IEWVTSDFSGLMGQLEGGKLDTVANVVAITPARQAKYNFSTPYSYYGSQIVTNKSNADINTLDDLRGKTIAGVLGSNHLVNLKKAFGDNGVTIRTYESRDGAMNDAINNRVQGYVNSGPILLAEINQKGLPLKFVGQPLVIESVGFPFHKDEKGDKLRAAFDKEVDAMRKDGRLKAISEKYFGEDITAQPSH
ncbi:transporter substrate-binding domain-containing protein, partial [Pantoea septica]